VAKGLILGALALLAVLGAILWQQRRADRAEWEAGLAASRTLSAVFERTSALQVARLSGEAITRVQGASGPGGLFRNVQVTRAPYAVDYTVDLSRLSTADYRWNPKERVMIVTVPEVTPAPPRVDMARARSLQDGIYISRGSGLAMGQRVAGNLAAAAGEKARAPDNMARAQAAARAAVQALVRAPLSAAGIGDVKVVVRLPGEARAAGVEAERWDESRPLAEVLREAR
jgi:hypothetical protein